MIWPWQKRETRSYTEDRIAASTRAAEGKAAGTALATIEACAGLWARGFASAESDALAPGQLSMIGRSLLTTGNSVWLVDGGRVTLPAHTWTVTGGPDPALWNYRLDIPGPSTTDTVQRSASDVLHVRIDPEVARPWSGVSPFVRCADTRDLLCEVERSLRDEHSGPVGCVIPVPAMPVREDGSSPLDDLQRDIAALAGRVVLGETTAGGWAEGRNAAPVGDWRPQRIGPMPQQYTVASRLDAERSIMGAAGVPVALVNPEAGTDSREAWRRFLHGTLAPLARIVGGRATAGRPARQSVIQSVGRFGSRGAQSGVQTVDGVRHGQGRGAGDLRILSGECRGEPKAPRPSACRRIVRALWRESARGRDIDLRALSGRQES